MTTEIAIKKDITPEVWNTLKNSIYPGASDASVRMVLDYCVAQNLDPLLKPVHIVPMNGKDVVMPGIGFYRIQAARSGVYAGMSEAEFGPSITEEWNGKYGPVKVRYPEWCKITVNKLLGDKVIAFTAIEYWKENYATQGGKDCPNTMWAKRPFAQLAKCAEAQALRKAFPEIAGGLVTAEEMEGKSFENAKVVNEQEVKKTTQFVDETRKTATENLFNIDGKFVEAMDVHSIISQKIEEIDSQDSLNAYEEWKHHNQHGLAEFAKKNKEMAMMYAESISQKRETLAGTQVE